MDRKTPVLGECSLVYREHNFKSLFDYTFVIIVKTYSVVGKYENNWK
jgi:hypothetical protein